MPQHRIDLPGLDAANLLGYLAALGTLRTLTLARPEAEARMSWTESPGWWMPVIHSAFEEQEELIAALAERLSGPLNPAWELGKDLTVDPACFREKAQEFARTRPPQACEFLAAFGSDGCLAAGKQELIADTDFRTMSGAGHQHFLGFMRDLHEKTGAEHLAATLFRTWEYADEKPSMRWDPNDYRPHALRAADPATDPIRTVRGANRLALEALPLFPTMPRCDGLWTTGFDEHARLCCPVWEPAIEMAAASSLLALNEYEINDDDGGMRRETQRARLAARGISQVYRAARFTEGKYRNFSPSEALL